MQPGNHTGFVQDISKPEVLVFLQFFGKLNQFLNFGSESSSTNTEETRLITMRSQPNCFEVDLLLLLFSFMLFCLVVVIDVVFVVFVVYNDNIFAWVISNVDLRLIVIEVETGGVWVVVVGVHTYFQIKAISDLL